jgi:hypothetical protein
MQLHPTDSQNAVKHCIESLAAYYIGLDFDENLGDLTKIRKEKLPENQHDYWAFANTMKIGDIVLIIAHHFPFALVTVASDYNYIKNKAPELGVWFKHFRKVDNIKYYADYTTNAYSWQNLIMTDTISPLWDKTSSSFKLIEEWVQEK